MSYQCTTSVCGLVCTIADLPISCSYSSSSIDRCESCTTGKAKEKKEKKSEDGCVTKKVTKPLETEKVKDESEDEESSSDSQSSSETSESDADEVVPGNKTKQGGSNKDGFEVVPAEHPSE